MSGRIAVRSRMQAARFLAAATSAVVALTMLSSCGSTAGPGSGSPTTPSTTTTARPSALGQLQPFLAAARAVDGKLRAAATAVNGGMRPGGATFTAATAEAVHAADPDAAAAALPAGLPASVLRPVLVVFADLASRRAAFNQLATGTWSSDSPEYGYLERCLPNGATAAARFAGDVRAVEQVAAATPVAAVAGPDSRSGEELAVRLELIRLHENGCGSCGGYVPDDFPAVAWTPSATQSTDRFPPVAGNVNGLNFAASYAPGSGWKVVFQAC